MPDLPPATARRVAVLLLRQRLEAAAALAHDRVVKPESPSERREIRNKLALLLALPLGDGTIRDRLHLVRLGRLVYKRSSDLLHGRSTLLVVSQPTVDEWEAVVIEIEAIAKA